MPTEWERCLGRWRELHPGWELTLWTPDTLPPLVNARFWDHRRWSRSSRPGMWQANLVRYELLWRFGGVWVDCDLEPLRPIDGLLDGVGCFAAWETQYRWVNNAFMGAAAGHPAMQVLVDGIPGSIAANRGKRSNHCTGARFITPLLTARDDVTIFDQQMVYPYRWDQTDQVSIEEAAERFPDAWTVHHWGDRRRPPT